MTRFMVGEPSRRQLDAALPLLVESHFLSRLRVMFVMIKRGENAGAGPPSKSMEEKRMPIPQTILRSEQHAQHIWQKAHDHARETYGEGARAHRADYAALKHEYEKKGDKRVRKAEKGPSDSQAAREPTIEYTHYAEPRAKTAKERVETSEKK